MTTNVESALCTDMSALEQQAEYQQFPCFIVNPKGLSTYIYLKDKSGLSTQRHNILNAIHANKDKGGVKMAVKPKGKFVPQFAI